MSKMQVCFIGHRTIEKNEKLISLLKETVVMLIGKGVIKFLFGSMSKFDDLALQVVTDIKKEYPNIQRIYVRSANMFITKEYEEYLLKYYDQTYFLVKIEKAGKFSYVERNFEMIDKSTYCVFYYNEEYVPKIKKRSKDKIELNLRRNSGTKIAYQYAVKKKEEIINLYK